MGRLSRIVLWAATALLVISAALPFVLMLLTAFQRTTTLRFEIDPDALTFGNFADLMTVHGFGQALVNTTVVVLIACALNNIVCATAAYGFAVRPFPGSKTLFAVYLLTMMIPSQVTMIPLFLIFREAGLLGGYLSLALPVVNAFGVFLIHQFMVSIPVSLFEAARIDGASDRQIFVSIVLPIIRPVLVTLTVFTFLTTWNDFLWPLVSVNDDSMRTVTLAVAQLKGSFETQYGMVMAGTTIAFTVPFLVYVLLQKAFVEGVASTGVKG
ncbi:carbohydrate ABC transporter membrane protein 2, CUT1 family [Austwickia chelonae]|uniref:Putative ABC transporter permease protein n=1 Tax=Austwickia chelonae NBRC 105200 TaxID=1184607 RepID=K6VML5_9MICO|nr:carbohydrate ABC transporter permease [Austwickia chelonae]GAB77969.1 putative ABC transporter permease protein [Austwickia chelonae NBRC 105200]SEV93314.1 carbohydrate ABC transporter membrane protein 2, CUT1 family [Austwickia chelonae]